MLRVTREPGAPRQHAITLRILNAENTTKTWSIAKDTSAASTWSASSASSQNTQTKSHIENKSYRKSRTGFKAKILKTESNSK